MPKRYILSFIYFARALAVVALITLLLGPQAEFKLRELREQSESEATIAGRRSGMITRR